MRRMLLLSCSIAGRAVGALKRQHPRRSARKVQVAGPVQEIAWAGEDWLLLRLTNGQSLQPLADIYWRVKLDTPGFFDDF